MKKSQKSVSIRQELKEFILSAEKDGYKRYGGSMFKVNKDGSVRGFGLTLAKEMIKVARGASKRK